MAPRRSARVVENEAAKADAAAKAAKAKTTIKTTVKTTVKTATNARPIQNATGTRKVATAKTTNNVATVKKTTTKRKAQDAAANPTKKPRAKKVTDAEEQESELACQGPKRRGAKKIINPVRYTQELDVFVMGEGSAGELGLGAGPKTTDVKRPRFNERLSNMGVVRVVAGGMHNVALSKDNKIITWGVNDNGALGRDTAFEDIVMRDADDDSDSDSDDPGKGLNPKEATPTAIPSEFFPKGTTFVDVAAGDSCTFALTDEGYVYGWGCFRKNEGILGFTKSIEIARKPVWIDRLQHIVKIECGTNHVLAIDNKGKVWTWGSGQQNQLGRRVLERTMKEVLVPYRIGTKDLTNAASKSASKKMVDVACGDYHSFALADDGTVWSWGANNYCETGHPSNAGGDDATIEKATVVQSLLGQAVAHIAAGAHHNLVVKKNAELLAWGRCEGAILGIPKDQMGEADLLRDEGGRAKILTMPTVVPGVNNVTFATCGPDHNIVLSSGKAFSWGFSATYQTGQGTDDDVELPTLIDNTAVRTRELIWAGCGGQFSLLGAARKGQ